MRLSSLKAYLSIIFDKVLGNTEHKKVILNIGWLFADKILRLSIGFIVVVWLARYLGSEQFGLFNYVSAFVMLFSAIAPLGIDNILVRDVVNNDASRDENLGSAFILKLVGATFSIIVSMLFIIYFKPNNDLIHGMVAILAIGIIFKSFDVIEIWFNANKLVEYGIIARIVAFTFVSLINIVFILTKMPLITFIWTTLLEIILGAAFIVIIYQFKGFRLLSWQFKFSRAKKLFANSWPLMLSDMVGMIYLRIDQVMLGQMVGSQEVGVYSAAVRIAEAWYFIPTSIYIAVLPSIVAAKSISDEVFYARLQKLYNIMTLLGYCIAIPMTFCSQWLAVHLFGPEYIDAGPMLAVLVWAGIFINLGVARSTFLTTMNWTKVHFVTILLGSIVNILLNLILIPRYGGMGAIVASLMAYWIAAHGSCFLYKPLFRTGIMMTRSIFYPKVW